MPILATCRVKVERIILFVKIVNRCVVQDSKDAQHVGSFSVLPTPLSLIFLPKLDLTRSLWQSPLRSEPLKASKINYTISLTLRAIRLVAIYDPMEDRSVNDVIANFFTSLLSKTNRFPLAVCLFSNRSQKRSKCGKNISDTFA